MIITRTPFRISFFGGGSDYPSWFEEEGGSVLVTTIDKYCYITARYLPPFFQHRYRIMWSEIEMCSTVDEIHHPVIKAVLNDWKFNRGLEIHHDADLPARSGIGSSSAFTVGFLRAMHALAENSIDVSDLADQAIRMEQDVLKETVGCQDQVSTAFGGFNRIDFAKGRKYAVTPVAAPAARITELNDHMILIYTGIPRTASEIADAYVGQLKSQSKNIYKMMELVGTAQELIAGSGPIGEFGTLLDETWKRKKEISGRISNNEVDSIYESAQQAGAIGGKLLGAGGGGFMLLFVPPEKRSDVLERLSSLVAVPFKFETEGSKTIFVDSQEDYFSGGAVEQMTATSTTSSESNPQ
jgi:D-glycero-alpha-D-manno-heptose-7-phosphate kinase